MIAFEARVSEEIKNAMKAKDQILMDCLRAIKSALKYKDVEKSQAGVTEEEAIAIFQTMIKQRKEAVDQYEKFNKADQAAKEKREIEIIQAFLPAQLSESDVKNLIKEAITATGAASGQDMGKVMKELKPKISGRADAKVVSELVKAALAG